MPWLHQGRIVRSHKCHQLKKLSCFAHWTSLNVKGAMNSRMKLLHAENVVVQFQAIDGSVNQESRCYEGHRPLMTPWKGIYSALYEVSSSANSCAIILSSLLGWTIISSNAARSEGTACFNHVLFDGFAQCCVCDWWWVTAIGHGNWWERYSS